MKYILLILVIALTSCKTDSKNRVDSNNNTSNVECALSQLTQTTNFNNELEKYAGLPEDTVVQIEQKKIGDVHYKTVFNKREFEEMLWLIVQKEHKTDSIMLHYQDYVEGLLTVDVKFELNDCQIIKTETTYELIGDGKNTEVETFKF